MKQNNNLNSVKLFLALVLATICLPVWSDPIDENTARQVATQILSRSSATDKMDSVSQRAQAAPQKTLQLLYKSSSKTKNAAKQIKISMCSSRKIMMASLL